MTAGAVILGLIVAGLVSVLDGQPEGPMPGIALGSAPLLLVERAAALFTAWMVALVVVAQALKGRLPTEISRQGVRYATAETQASAEEIGRRHDMEIAQIREAIVTLDRRYPDAGKEID